MKRAVQFIFGVLLTSTALQLPAVETRAEGNAQTIPSAYFGLHIHRIVQTAPWDPSGDKITPWPPVQFGSWRLWDAYVAWPNLEPARGKWNFKTLDKYVDLAEQSKIDVVLPLGLSPSWASARPDEKSVYRAGNAAEPRDIEDWRTYVQTVGERYKGRIKHYELWNEVNVKGFYSGTPEKLVELARVAYKTLKEIDPEIVFASPSVVGKDNYSWLDEYLSKGGASYLDAVTYHFYVTKASPEAMLPAIQKVRGLMQKHGVSNKPLWNTETGWWIENSTEAAITRSVRKDWRKLTDDMAMAYVARAFLLSWPAGVSRLYWYAWDNINMGLIQPGSQQLKPAAKAFDTTAGWLAGSEINQCSREEMVWNCEISRPNGESARAIWTEDDRKRVWNTPAGWNVMRIDRLDGTSFTPSGNTMQIGAAPILLIIEGSPH